MKVSLVNPGAVQISKKLIFQTKIHLCRSHTQRLESLQRDARAIYVDKFLSLPPLSLPADPLVGDGALQKPPPQRVGCEERGLLENLVGIQPVVCTPAKNSPKDSSK